jgi:hypothetical protein
MNKKLKAWILHYFYGAFASVWNGVFSTAYVSFGAAGANAAGLVDLHDITWKGFASTLGGTILFHCVIYFYNHKIPDDLPENGSGPTETLSSAMVASMPNKPVLSSSSVNPSTP